ncbi:MAG: UDP-N-acetylmuramoyl-tripeptide--D-alanyl-D-alanine ligase [Phycisphaerae bacterium]|nr:UDP-N-acetylmuramoyl-tripeptide--D-alanyl-D-alanine ligase [Phycisphaerae bacterium]
MIPLMLDEIAEAIGAEVAGDDASQTKRPQCSATGVSIDSRRVRCGDLFVAIAGENHDGHAFVAAAIQAGAVAAVVQQGYVRPADLDSHAILLVVDDPVVSLGRLGRFHRRQLAADVIGVTGSNGKTTTRDMITHVLRDRWRGRCAVKSFNNEIGVPLTLLSAEASDEFLVVELGTNAPGEIDTLARLAMPEIAVVTGVAPAHLERLGNIEGVVREKLSLLKHVRAGGCAIVNTDHELVREHLAHMMRPAKGVAALPKDVKVITFGRHADADLRLTAVRTVGAGPGAPDNGRSLPSLEFEVNGKFTYRLGVLGAHNAMNALAAIAVGRRFGLDDAAIAERLDPANGFVLPSMRLEHRRGGPDGRIDVIVDVYNANPASVAAAIDVLSTFPCVAPGRRVLVLGDMRELGSHADSLHQDVARRAAEGGVDVMLAVGAHADRMATAVRAWQRDGVPRRAMDVHTVADAEAAAGMMTGLCRSGDVVLVKGSRLLALERVAEALMLQPH